MKVKQHYLIRTCRNASVYVIVRCICDSKEYNLTFRSGLSSFRIYYKPEMENDWLKWTNLSNLPLLLWHHQNVFYSKFSYIHSFILTAIEQLIWPEKGLSHPPKKNKEEKRRHWKIGNVINLSSMLMNLVTLVKSKSHWSSILITFWELSFLKFLKELLFTAQIEKVISWHLFFPSH